MSEGGPRMLRMVRWQSVMQDADRLRNWPAQDPLEALARTIHMGDPDTARQALLEWLKRERRALQANPNADMRDAERLRATYLEMRSKIHGRAMVLDTELGFWSQNVGPDYDQTVYDYAAWANYGNLNAIFDEGHEIVLTGHMGTGKSHLAVSLMEYLLALFRQPRVYIITNIAGIEDSSGKYADRIFHVSLLSEILRIWTELPASARIVLFLDEPESNLRGGSSKNVRVFGDFRYMLRKLGMSKFEIWHNESEVYKSLREEDSEHVTRITKAEKTTMTVHRVFRGKPVEQHIQGVHDLKFLRYAHRGMASIDVDVVMRRIISRLAKLHRSEDMKKAVQAALDDASYYMDEFKADKEHEASDAAVGPEQIIKAVLADPLAYLTEKRHVDSYRLRREFDLTVREADSLARDATKRWRAATPDWRRVKPLRDDPPPQGGEEDDGEE